MLGNNAIFALSALLVLFGTLAPLIWDVLGLGKISVGPPYFNLFFVPLMLLMAVLLSIGPLLSWGQAGPNARKRWLIAAATGTAAVAIFLAATGYARWLVLAAMLPAGWVAASAFWLPLSRWRRGRVAAITRSEWGMCVAHVGVAVFIVGATLVSSFSAERQLRVVPGDTVTVQDLQFRFHDVLALPGPNYLAQVGHVRVSEEGALLAELNPEKRQYRAGGNVMTEAGIAPGFSRDIYVSLGEPLDDQGAWSARFYIKPFIRWIWAGAFLMAIGGGLAASDPRYRRARTKARAASSEVEQTGTMVGGAVR